MTKVGCAQLESSVFSAIGWSCSHMGDLLTGLTLSADCHLGPLTRAPQFSSRWPPARFVLFRSWKPIVEERNRKVHCRFLKSPFTIHSKKLHRVAFVSSYQAQLISGQVRLQMGNDSKFFHICIFKYKFVSSSNKNLNCWMKNSISIAFTLFFNFQMLSLLRVLLYITSH